MIVEPFENVITLLKANELIGLTFSGSVIGGINGGWYRTVDIYGELTLVNSKATFENDGYVLYWNSGTSKWIVATAVGATALYTRTNASYAGTYAPVAPATDILTVTADTVYPRRYRGDDSQTVVTPFRIVEDEGAWRYTQYGVQIAYFMPSVNRGWEYRDEQAAVKRLQAALRYFKSFKGMTTGAPKITLANWSAQFVRTEDPGFTDKIDITAGALFKAIGSVHLLNVRPL